MFPLQQKINFKAIRSEVGTYVNSLIYLSADKQIFFPSHSLLAEDLVNRYIKLIFFALTDRHNFLFDLMLIIPE